FPLIRYFLFTPPATPKIYTLSLHDALPIYQDKVSDFVFPQSSDQKPVNIVFKPDQPPPFTFTQRGGFTNDASHRAGSGQRRPLRSEEHTSELQSLAYLVCRLLLEKKKKI